MQSKNNAVPVLGFFGSLIPRKGLDVLIDAFAMLLASGRKCRLKIGGKEQTQNYRDRVEHLHIEDHVEFVGEVPHHKVATFFENVNLHVLPSHSEATPLTMIEAAMCGVPSIANDVGGTSEALMDGKLGVLYNVNTPDNLCRVLATLLDEGEWLKEDKCILVAELSRSEFSVRKNAEVLVSMLSSTI
jgi:glycosyltransferase involved in cell wall biosynthesis